MRSRVISGALGVLALLAAGCGDGGETTAGGESAPVVVATTSIWADVLANVACDGDIDVRTLMPAGADPHRFEPSLADRVLMDGAAVVIANGLLLEESLEDTLEAVEKAGTPVFRIGDHVSIIPYGFHEESHDEDEGNHGDHEDHESHEDHDDDADHGEHEGDHDDHGHDGDDPHVWFDPRRVSGVLAELGEQVVTHAGLDAAAVQRCVADYQDALVELDSEIAAMAAGVPEANRLLVTSHDALGYFAERYGFEVIGTVIPVPSGLAETNPAQLEELAETISKHGVSAIFAETQHSTRDADALANRVGDVEVVTLFTGTLGETGSGTDTYLGFMRTNAALITEALS